MNFNNIPAFSSPAAWLDMDSLDHNIKLVNSKTNGKNLRIASKSVRNISVLKYVAENSPDYIGLMSYDAAESQYLLENGFADVLCAYPQMNKAAITDAEKAASNLTDSKLTWMVDKPEHVTLLAEIGSELKKDLRLCIDINTSTKYPAVYFGTQRSQIDSVKKLKKFLKVLKKTSNIQVVGLMGYEGQIAGLPEAAAGKEALAPAIRLLKSRSKKYVTKFRRECVDAIADAGIALEVVNGGGSGSMDFTCSRPEVTEITVGSAYYMPAYFSYMDTMQEFKPAAGFVLPVTRKPFPKTATCHSGGFIASGAVGKDKWPVIHYPENVSYLPDEGCGEVQTPVKLKQANQLDIGDNVWFRHAKAGELCEHFNELHVFRNNKLIDTFATYRGQGKCFH